MGNVYCDYWFVSIELAPFYMAPFKRKRGEDDEDDEDDLAYGKQILPVANLPDDFDEEPLDGMQYLFTVRRDARYLPHVVRAVNPYEIPEVAKTTIQDTIAPHPSLPSREWCRLLETRLSNFRKNLNQPTIHVGPAHAAHQKLMPDKKERDHWWDFLAGKPETYWNPPKKAKPQHPSTRKQYGQGLRAWESHSMVGPPEMQQSVVLHGNDDDEVRQLPSGEPTETPPSPKGTTGDLECPDELVSPNVWSKLPGHPPREPSTTLLKLIDERMALHLLMYFTHWINLYLQQRDQAHYPEESHARWIFALLARVDDHISADDMNLLRNVARACLAFLKFLIKGRITSTVQGLSPTNGLNERSCWIIVSTIIGNWKQRDLWMDAEDMLKEMACEIPQTVA